MARSSKKTAANEKPAVGVLEMAAITLGIIGKTPILPHRFADKARRQLLLPGKRVNRAGLESMIKHDVPHEYRQSLYKNRDTTTPAMFHLPGGMIVKAMASAALDMSGATKAKTLRLISVSPQINLFGLPFLHMAMVRQDGPGKVPDVRTRACFPDWACVVTIEFPAHAFSGREIFNLLAAAGHVAGFGDWRQERGGQMGKFEVCDAKDPRIVALMKSQGRAAQQQAYDSPVAFDDDTQELLDWYHDEIVARQQGDQLIIEEDELEAAE